MSMARNDDDYAIVIGISNYAKLLPLNSADADATKFAEWLASDKGGGLSSDHIFLATGPTKIPTPLEFENAKPTQIDVDKFFKRMGVEGSNRIGRRLYFYFAGHGFGPTYDDVGLLMMNAGERNFNGNLGFALYRKLFREYPYFEEVIFILDCCRNPTPALGNLQLRAPDFTPLGAPTPVELEEMVVMGSLNGQPAFAVAGQANGNDFRGLLTSALLEGLQTAYDSLGRITTDSLRRYILDRVPEMAAINNVTQKADIASLPNRTLVFFDRPPEEMTFKVHVFARKKLTGTLTLYDSKSVPIASLPAREATRDNPWELTLSRSIPKYAIQHSVTEESQFIISSTVTEEPYVIKFA